MKSCLNIIPKYSITPSVISSHIRSDLLKNYSKSTQNFYLHLFMSIYNNSSRRYVSISHKYVRKYFRTTINKSEIEKLVFANLLLRTKYDKNGGMCREYSIPNNILYNCSKLIFEELKKGESNIFKRKCKRYHKERDLCHYKNGILRTKLIFNELNKVTPMVDDTDKIEIVKKKFAHYLETKEDDILHDIQEILGTELKRLRKLPESERVYEYKPTFKISKTGRIFELGGGVQTMHKDLKRAMYNHREHFHNYDIRSCHMAALAQEAGSMGINVTVLEEYIDNPEAKYEYAAKAGLEVNIFKTCLLSLLYGAESGYYGTPFKVLKEEYGNTEAKEKLKNFKEAVKDILEVQKQWITKLPEYIDKHKYKVRNKWYLQNAAEIQLDLENDEDAKCTKFLTAFIMQGLEAGFIAYITLLSDEYGYIIRSNEHDGVITEGKIPNEAIIKARKLSGFKNAILEIKPF